MCEQEANWSELESELESAEICPETPKRFRILTKNRYFCSRFQMKSKQRLAVTT